MILLTGASGFIGSHLLDTMIDKYGSDRIVVLTSQPTEKCRFLFHQDYKLDKDIFLKAGVSDIKTILHAGAFTPKTVIESNDIDQSNSNIINTSALLSTHLPNLRNFIFLSTLDVYGYDNPITEESNIKPVSLYGHSKLYCENLVTTWSLKKGINFQILRIGHVYGPGEEKYQKLIPMVMKQVLNHETVKLYGTGSDIRTFIYITDVVQSIINSIKSQVKNETINVVGEEQISIKDLIEKIIRITGQKVVIEKITSHAKPRNLIFDNSKLKKLLHKPSVSLEEGLRLEWEYIKQQ